MTVTQPIAELILAASGREMLLILDFPFFPLLRGLQSTIGS